MPCEIKRAMVLAAGRGTRMRHLTDEHPKPLIKVGGQTLLDRILDKIAAAGVTECVVNLCYLGDKIRDSLKNRKDMNFIFSEEEEALETGGGVKKALPFLGTDPFFVINADPVWTDPGIPALENMQKLWDPETTDILFMLEPFEHVFGHDGKGDYFVAPDGLPHRKPSPQDPAPYVYAGAQILHPRIFADSPDGKFSLNILYDKAEKARRLACYIHDGDWFHVGTPEAVALTEKALEG